jgi:hypothetical protein
MGYSPFSMNNFDPYPVFHIICKQIDVVSKFFTGIPLDHIDIVLTVNVTPLLYGLNGHVFHFLSIDYHFANLI